MRQLALFDSFSDLDLRTQGIKYVGSKTKLLRQILELAESVGAKKILDGFAGSTRVSQAFAKNGYHVTSNDAAVWAKTFGICYLINQNPPSHYFELLKHLNALPPKDGWFTQHYGGAANQSALSKNETTKKPWQIHNTRKLDSIREEIDELKLNSVDKAVAITSLILALDKVDNTLGHYVSYLKDWSPRSYKVLKMEVPDLFTSDNEHTVYSKDVFEVAPNCPVDLAYFDPPYGSNNEKMPPSRVRYLAYYHVWTTVCLNDAPVLFGKANRREDTRDGIAASIFEEFRQSESGRFIAVEAIEKLIKVANAEYVLLSYSSGGRATADDLNGALTASGKICKIIEIDYKKNVMAEMKWTKDWIRESEMPHREFLFLLKK
jgi:adenine-specific DNA-methyltransferase